MVDVEPAIDYIYDLYKMIEGDGLPDLHKNIIALYRHSESENTSLLKNTLMKIIKKCAKTKHDGILNVGIFACLIYERI